MEVKVRKVESSPLAERHHVSPTKRKQPSSVMEESEKELDATLCTPNLRLVYSCAERFHAEFGGDAVNEDLDLAALVRDPDVLRCES